MCDLIVIFILRKSDFPFCEKKLNGVGRCSEHSTNWLLALTPLNCFAVFSAILSLLMNQLSFIENFRSCQRIAEQVKTQKKATRNPLNVVLINEIIFYANGQSFKYSSEKLTINLIESGGHNSTATDEKLDIQKIQDQFFSFIFNSHKTGIISTFTSGGIRPLKDDGDKKENRQKQAQEQGENMNID